MRAEIAVPATLALIYRAWSHNSLTSAGIVAAALTAIAHAVHPWNLPFALLVVFFLAGTKATKVKKEVKEKLTVQSTGSQGGEGPRTHVQVLANSAVASVLSLLHAYQLHSKPARAATCYPWGGNLLVVGIIANYAAVAADTFSSELGILSNYQPRLITSLQLRKVPKGTNGGVTLWGLVAGLMGSGIIVASAVVLLPWCGSPVPEFITGAEGLKPLFTKAWSVEQIVHFALGLTVWGSLGSVLDSLLGGWFQQSVLDTRTGRIIEGPGGGRVLVHNPSSSHSKGYHYLPQAELKALLLSGEGEGKEIPKPATEDEQEVMQMKKGRQPSFGDGKDSRRVESGRAVLDNNEVNFLMALTMSLGGMALAAWYWGVPFESAFSLR